MVSSNSQETWSTCAPGELSRLSTAAKRKSQQKRVIRAVSSVVTGTACVLLLINFVGNSGQLSGSRNDSLQSNSVANSYSCGEVLDRTDSYLLGELDAEQSQLVRTHLEHCRRCQVAYRGRAVELKVEFVVMVLPPSNYFAVKPSNYLAVK